MKNRVFVLLFLLVPATPALCQMSFNDSVPVIKNLLKGELPPETRLKFLSKLCVYYWQINPDSSLWYGMQGKALFNDKMPLRRIGRHQFALGMAWENKGNFDSALWYLNQGADNSVRAGDTKYQYRAVEQIGSLFRIMGRYDTAVVLMNRALEYFKSTGNNYQIMSVLFNIGSVYLEQNRLNKALQFYQASSAYDTILKDSSAIATHLLGVGEIYLNLGYLIKPINPEKSKNYFSLSRQNFSECAKLFLGSDNRSGKCFSSMSMLSNYIGAGMTEQADSLLRADSACLSFHDPRISASFQISQAHLLNNQGKKSQALALLQKVAGAKGEIVILPEFHDAMLLMADLLRATGNHDSAWKVAEKSLAWGKKNSIYPIAYKALSMMTNWFDADGKPIRALTSTREAGLYKDSLFIEMGKEIFDETDLRFKNLSLQSAVAKLEDDRKLEKFRNLIIKLTGTVAILILMLVITWLLARYKSINRKRRDVEQKMRLSEQEKKLSETAVETLHLAMQLKEQELIYHTLQSANLNQTNQSIRERLGEFRFRFPKKKDQDDFNLMMTEVHRDAQQDPLSDLERTFGQIHGGFYEKLLDACPELSKAELQICALLRINLSSKDIARLVNLSASTIDVTRSHIRKKLGLDQSQTLTSYLIMLG